MSITIYFKAVGFDLSFRVLLLIRILTKKNGLRFSSLGRPLPKVPGTLLSCKNGFKVQLGSFSNDDGDKNEERQKSNGSVKQKNNFPRAARFFVHLRDYDVKMPDFTLYGGHKQATTNFSFSFQT